MHKLMSVYNYDKVRAETAHERVTDISLQIHMGLCMQHICWYFIEIQQLQVCLLAKVLSINVLGFQSKANILSLAF